VGRAVGHGCAQANLTFLSKWKGFTLILVQLLCDIKELSMRDFAALFGPLARILGGSLGLEISRAKTHRGISLETDLARLLTKYPLVFIDAGANVGTFSRKMLNAFRIATIVAFEPVPQTFAVLKRRMAGFPQIRPVQAALGEQPGSATMHLYAQSGWNRIVSETDTNSETVIVDVTTIDEFCERMNLTKISLLKTDCEGYDNKVVRGADRMLRAGRVDAVYCEVNFRRDGAHGDFFDLDEYLTGHDFFFYALYDYSAPSSPTFANALWVRCGN
jgi:FkbM family methyltransferase